MLTAHPSSPSSTDWRSSAWQNTVAAARAGTPSVWVLRLSFLYFLVVAAVWTLVFPVSESHWIGSLLTYAPRSPWAVPAIALITSSLLWNRRALVWNVLSLALVVVPLMELRFNFWAGASEGEPDLRVLSSNMETFRRDYKRVMAEIAGENPDVVMFQEAHQIPDDVRAAFAKWHVVHRDFFFIASKQPIEFVEEIESPEFQRVAGVIVRTEFGGRPLLLANLHLMTFRKGIDELSPRAVISGDLAAGLEMHQVLRRQETILARARIEAARGDKTMIIAGDFNAPSSSNIYWPHWGDFTNAFDAAGAGFGYTSPCKKQGPWPEGLPWARIDHILGTPDCKFLRCHVGRGEGSDHKLIVAEVDLP